MGREKDFQQAAMMLQSKQPVGSKQLAVANQQPMQNIQADPVTIAQQLMQNGKSAEAENVFKNILAKDSANTKALFNLGLLYYTERRLPDAEAAWKKAVKLDSTYTDAFNNLAICLAQQGKNSEAEIVLKKVISSNPDYNDGYFNIANFYARNGKDKEALAYIAELKKRGIGKETYLQRGIKLSPELEKLFDRNN
jgi:tetratricopeptide (TPR) repeat protein